MAMTNRLARNRLTATKAARGQRDQAGDSQCREGDTKGPAGDLHQLGIEGKDKPKGLRDTAPNIDHLAEASPE